MKAAESDYFDMYMWVSWSGLNGCIEMTPSYHLCPGGPQIADTYTTACLDPDNMSRMIRPEKVPPNDDAKRYEVMRSLLQKSMHECVGGLLKAAFADLIIRLGAKADDATTFTKSHVVLNTPCMDRDVSAPKAKETVGHDDGKYTKWIAEDVSTMVSSCEMSDRVVVVNLDGYINGIRKNLDSEEAPSRADLVMPKRLQETFPTSHLIIVGTKDNFEMFEKIETATKSTSKRVRPLHTTILCGADADDQMWCRAQKPGRFFHVFRQAETIGKGSSSVSQMIDQTDAKARLHTNFACVPNAPMDTTTLRHLMQYDWWMDSFSGLFNEDTSCATATYAGGTPPPTAADVLESLLHTPYQAEAQKPPYEAFKHKTFDLRKGVLRVNDASGKAKEWHLRAHEYDDLFLTFENLRKKDFAGLEKAAKRVHRFRGDVTVESVAVFPESVERSVPPGSDARRFTRRASDPTPSASHPAFDAGEASTALPGPPAGASLPDEYGEEEFDAGGAGEDENDDYRSVRSVEMGLPE